LVQIRETVPRAWGIITPGAATSYDGGGAISALSSAGGEGEGKRGNL